MVMHKTEACLQLRVQRVILRRRVRERVPELPLAVPLAVTSQVLLRVSPQYSHCDLLSHVLYLEQKAPILRN
jgi:hypothetical protein